MKKVLLVDDEAYILDLLEKIIPWDFYGFEIVGTAENAAEAMKLYHKEKPDVIITDICMENISGIEFITRIRMQNTAVKIIILSAYDKFEYAQKALKLNVNGYLLKPVNREELLNTLIEVQKELESKSDYQDRIAYLQESLENLRERYLEEQLLRVYAGEQKELPKEAAEEGFWRVLSIQTIVRNEIVFLEQDIKAKEGIRGYVLVTGDGRFAVFLHGNSLELLEGTVFEIRRRYCQEEKVMLCGASESGARELAAQCQESRRALDTLFYRENQYFTDRLKTGDQERSENGVRLDEEAFLLLLTRGEAEKISSHFVQYLDDCRAGIEKRDRVLGYFTECMGWLEAFCHRQTTAEKLQEIATKAQTVIWAQDLQKLFEESVKLTAENSREVSRAEAVIAKAQAYIRNNCCREDFSVDALACELHISKSYLSKIYKEETGESVWNYVMQVRIAKARELLVTTDCTNFAIAREIGYSSEYHFSRAFSKMVGVSPTAYKKMYLKLQ